ncbi:MAG TPA: PilN domain-containing protein [Actinomycetota bacterium]|nr:PilN domain-containing protein [Actinomycetota bacterium]
MAPRRVNLLPATLEAGRRARRQVFAIGAAGVALVSVLGVVYALQNVRLRNERTKLEAQQSQNAVLRAEVAQLADFAALERELNQKIDLLSGLTKNEVRWSILLSNMSLVIPSDVWLTNLSGSVTAQTGARDDNEQLAVLGTIQLNGTTLEHIDVARWLTRLAGVDEFALPYLSLSTKATIGSTEVVNFNSSVQLSQDAFRRNQRAGERRV